MKNRKGSTIGLVLVATLAIGIVVAAVASLINFQRNMSVRRELQFQAANVAETAIDYAFAYIANDVKRNSIETSEFIPKEGYKKFDFNSEAIAFLTGAIPGPSSFTAPTSGVTFSDISVRILPPSGEKKPYNVERSIVGSRLSEFSGQVVYETTVPVVARACASSGGTSKQTAYIKKNMAFDEVPMFQKAITYQGQLHLHRGYPILGGVHTNGNLVINAHNGDTAVYNGLITCAGRFYRGSAFDVGGTGADPYGYCPENAKMELDFSTDYVEDIQLAATNTKNLKIITSDPSDSKITATYAQLDTDMDSRRANWKQDALTTFKGNLMDKSHEVALMLPPGCEQYRLDDATTKDANEFANGTYVLLHPNITDPAHPAYNTENIYQFARRATLLFRVECLANYKGTTSGDTTEQTYKWIVKAYQKYEDSQDDSTWVPLPMPAGVIGQTKVQTWATTNAQYEIATNVIDTTKVLGSNAANPYLEGLFEEYRIHDDSAKKYASIATYIINNHVTAIDSVAAGIATASKMGSLNSDKLVTGFILPSSYTLISGTASKPVQIKVASGTINAVQQAPAHGFFDARLGRGVSPITINMKVLKDVLDGTDTSEAATAFRTLLGVGSGSYNGLVYVEFPTSLTTVNKLSARCYKEPNKPYPGDMTAVDSYAFAVGDKDAIEKRHPDRMSDTDSRKDRTDNIIAIAKTLRGYPGSYDDAEISKAKWAIPALVLVNGRKLPTVSGVNGLTISTNAPLYLIGSYNADGDFATGTNITGTKPTDYATGDSGEVSAGLFSDTLTILSDSWGKPVTNSGVVDGSMGKRFLYSFNGYGGSSSSYRKVGDGQVEISACILTGEYPIFEFFLHGLESWEDYYNKGGLKNSPICIKGAVVGMFHSEIQHIKGAYKRDLNTDIQVYYTGHGNCAIPAVRMHEKIMKGIFPPGTPKARAYGQNAFQFLRPGSTDDTEILKKVGF